MYLNPSCLGVRISDIQVWVFYFYFGREEIMGVAEVLELCVYITSIGTDKINKMSAV